MVTFTIIMLIWFIISYRRLNKIAKEKNKEINPFDGNIFDFFGFLVGSASVALFVIYFMFTYLP